MAATPREGKWSAARLTPRPGLRMRCSVPLWSSRVAAQLTTKGGAMPNLPSAHRAVAHWAGPSLRRRCVGAGRVGGEERIPVGVWMKTLARVNLWGQRHWVCGRKRQLQVSFEGSTNPEIQQTPLMAKF